MTKAQGKAEFRYFLDPVLKAAAMHKAKENGWTLTFVLDRFLKDWVTLADIVAAQSLPEKKPKKGKGEK